LTIEPVHVPEVIPPTQTVVPPAQTVIPPTQTVIADTETIISKEVSLPLENGKLSVTENVIPVIHVKESSHHVKELEQPTSIEKVASNTQEDTPKKSFASIVSFTYLFIYLCLYFFYPKITFLQSFVQGECLER
jgi:hypothetical protein